jgi:hypothetical protein
MKHRPKDPRGGHARLYWALLDSPAYLALGFPARALYVDLRRKLGQTNNGNIDATLSALKHRGWRSSTTLSKALKELVAVGLIAQTRQGGIASMSKMCSLYRFTDETVYEHPKLGISKMAATYEYKRFTSLGEARAAVREARQPRQKNDRKLHKVQLTTALNAAMSPFIAASNAQEARPKLHKVQL